MKLHYFHFENNASNETVILADGLEEKYDIERKQELVRITVESTGYMAGKLLINHNEDIQQQFNDEIKSTYDDINTYECDFSNLESVNVLVEKVVSLVVEVNKDK